MPAAPVSWALSALQKQVPCATVAWDDSASSGHFGEWQGSGRGLCRCIMRPERVTRDAEAGASATAQFMPLFTKGTCRRAVARRVAARSILRGHPRTAGRLPCVPHVADCTGTACRLGYLAMALSVQRKKISLVCVMHSEPRHCHSSGPGAFRVWLLVCIYSHARHGIAECPPVAHDGLSSVRRTLVQHSERSPSLSVQRRRWGLSPPCSRDSCRSSE
jgi:hypothetical protein